MLDAAGLATFAIGGSLKALGAGLDPIAAVLVGGITAVGGGVIRDVLAGQVPEVLRREMYASRPSSGRPCWWRPTTGTSSAPW